MHKICNYCNSLLSTSTTAGNHRRHDRQNRKRRRRSVLHIPSSLMLLIVCIISFAGILAERIAIVYATQDATSSSHHNHQINNRIRSRTYYDNNRIRRSNSISLSSAAFVDTKKSIHITVVMIDKIGKEEDDQ